MSPSTVETDVATVGPMDVDSAGNLAPKVVKQHQANELIQHVRANYPVELVVLEQRDEDRARTAALVHDEVLDTAREEFGDEEADGGVVKLLSARVRGKDQPLGEKAVCVLWQTPSGRTARGAFGYAPLAESIDNFDAKVAAGEITEVDETDAKDLKRTVERQEDTIKRLNARLAAQENGAESGDKPEEGSTAVPEGNSRDLIKALNEGEYSLSQVDALIEAENAVEAPRKTVLKAAEAAKQKLESGD